MWNKVLGVAGDFGLESGVWAGCSRWDRRRDRLLVCFSQENVDILPDKSPPESLGSENGKQRAENNNDGERQPRHGPLWMILFPGLERFRRVT